ncbi:hypothetical protein B4168_3968 [Anoxybacillus flavithermus]|nr:hypothetical protein GT20_2147 [Parageobacillus thermoglucosidasius TNO-09.020]KYD17655.1 hypothetical protein B4168_3968 [Anoxybacillus flavithermus]OAO84796.1 hypothetical protein GT23_3310 [Parageobacillus thermoglucosidasius]
MENKQSRKMKIKMGGMFINSLVATLVCDLHWSLFCTGSAYNLCAYLYRKLNRQQEREEFFYKKLLQQNIRILQKNNLLLTCHL